MISVRKSPNMMSTTGRIPVIAAPSASPVIPGSEIGESITRSGPNSSTSPDITLKGVPASATSSPMTYTVGSRRNSSASASLTACDGVVDGEHVLPVDVLGGDAEGGAACEDLARRRLRVVRVLVVLVVLAQIDDGQLPEGRHVHHLVDEALPEGAFAEEADDDLVGA